MKGLLSGLFASVVAITPSLALAQAKDTPEVSVGFFRVLPNGAVASSAIVSAHRVGDRFSAQLYADACAFGLTESAPPESATEVWQVSGYIVAFRAPDEVTVQLELRPIRSAGVTGPSQLVQDVKPRSPTVSLRSGSRATLYTLHMRGGSACDPGTIELAVSFDSKTVGQRPEYSAEAMREKLREKVQEYFKPGTLTKAVPAPEAQGKFIVESWLVHAVPNRPEEIEPLSAELTNGGLSRVFPFKPVTISVPNGSVTVAVSAVVRVTGATYSLVTRRQLLFNPPAEGGSPGAFSTSKTGTINGDAVIELAMPELEVPAGWPAVKDGFAVRIRIRPAGV